MPQSASAFLDETPAVKPDAAAFLGGPSASEFLGESPYAAILTEQQDFERRAAANTPEAIGRQVAIEEPLRYKPAAASKLALRIGVPLAVGVGTGGLGMFPAIAATGLSGAASELGAQGLEIAGGERQDVSLPQIAATGLLNAVPGIPLTRIASPAVRGAIRVGEGAGLGAAFPVIESGLEGKLPQIQDVKQGALFGAALGVPFGGIEALAALRQRFRNRPSNPDELAAMAAAYKEAGVPLPTTDVAPTELAAVSRAREQTGAERAGEAMVGAESGEIRLRRLAERMAGVTEPEQKVKILDQEVKLAGDTLTPAEERGALDLKQQFEAQIAARKAQETAQKEVEQQAKEAERIAKEQQKAVEDAQKQIEAANQPPEIPKSQQILEQAKTPPSIANVATEIGTQTSPFAVQGKLNELTATPAPGGQILGQEPAGTPAVAGGAAQGKTGLSQEMVTAPTQIPRRAKIQPGETIETAVERLAAEGETALAIAARVNSDTKTVREIAMKRGIAIAEKSKVKPDIVMTPRATDTPTLAEDIAPVPIGDRSGRPTGAAEEAIVAQMRKDAGMPPVEVKGGEAQDPNIGRSWNSPYGKQTIVGRVGEGTAPQLYSVITEGTGAERRYSMDSIEDTIKRNEHALTPEYAKEQADAAELRQLKAERDARQAEREKNTLAEIADFTSGDTPMAAGKKRDALLKQVAHNGTPMTRKTMIENSVAAGATVVERNGVRELTKPDGAFLGEGATTKAGMDYAEHLIAKPQSTGEPTNALPLESPAEIPVRNEPEAGTGVRQPDALDQGTAPARQETPQVPPGNVGARGEAVSEVAPTPREISGSPARPSLSGLSESRLASLAKQLEIDPKGMSGDRLRARIESNAHPDDIADMLARPAPQDIIDTLKAKKKGQRGRAYSGPEAIYDAAHDAAIDVAILGIRAGRTLVEVVQMAIARFRQLHPNATEEQVARLSQDIEVAHGYGEPVPGRTEAEQIVADAGGVSGAEGRAPATTQEAARMRQTRGAVPSSVITPIAGAGVGGGIGFTQTERLPGESDEAYNARRIQNAVIGAASGAAGGALLGALAQGARAARASAKAPLSGRVKLPTPGEGQGIRQTAEKVIENRQYPEKLRETLANDPDILYDKFALGELADRVSAASIPELQAMLTSANIRERLGATAELANRYSLSDDPALQKQGAELYSQLAQNLTNPAQLLGLGKLVKTPQGFVTAVNEQLKGLKRTLSKPQEDALTKLATRTIKAEQDLAAAERAAIEDFSDANEAAYRRAQKTAADAKKAVDDFVHQVSPESIGDITSKIIQGNLLTPLSLVANVFGNMVYQPVRRSATSIATVLDAIYSGVTSRERTFGRAIPLPSLRELEAAGDGIKIAARELLTGPGTDSYIKAEVQRGFKPMRSLAQAFTGENLAVRPDGSVALTDRAKKFIEGTLGIPAEVMFRFLNLGDKPFRRAAEMEIMLEQAGLKKLKGRELDKFLEFPDEATRNLIDTEGRRAIFAQENKGITKLNQFLDNGVAQIIGADKIPALAAAIKVFNRVIVPFRQFPVNYVMTALNFAAPELAIAKAVYHAQKGDRRKALQNIGEGALGMMMYGGANYLWDKGIISEPTDKDAKQRSVQYEQMGPQRINITGLNRALDGKDGSYKLGDLTMDWGRLGIPAATFYVFTRNAAKGQKEYARLGQKPPVNYATDRIAAIPGMASFALDQSFLSGTSAFLEAMRNPDPEGQEMQNWTRNAFRAVTSIAVPNTVEALARAQYEYIPDLKGDNLTETLKNTWDYKVMQLPKGDQAVLKRGLWGEPIPRTPEGKNAYINQFVDVTRAERKGGDAFKQKLIDLYKQTGTPDVYPTLPDRNVSVGGITSKLTPQDYENLQVLIGATRRKFAERVVADSRFLDPKMVPEKKILALKAAYAEGAKVGQQQFLAQPGIAQRYFPDLTGQPIPSAEESRVISRDPVARARLRQQQP